MSVVTCGCHGELTWETPYGEPYIERTNDIGFCRLHAAAPDLLAALGRLVGPAEDYRFRDEEGDYVCVYCNRASGEHYTQCPVLDAEAAIEAAAAKEGA